ncbi:hypothetical protein ACI6PS_03620 [Flavobacterium sp. PLA-1-15]|uniref:hypothetical protein n=1 Tax=Flavobacterium sp. PLA-1-15 TaxID=3380533 RepID=UPI003B78E5EF
MGKLNEPTPEKNTLLWKIGTAIFLMSMFINESFAVIDALGFSEKTENYIRSIGAFVYVIVTFYNFHKSKFDEKIKR